MLRPFLQTGKNILRNIIGANYQKDVVQSSQIIIYLWNLWNTILTFYYSQRTKN